MFSLLLFVSLAPIPNAAASGKSTYSVTDGYYTAKWNYEFTHPEQVICSWGKNNPSNYPKGVICEFTGNFTWNWAPEPAAIISGYYPCAKPCSRYPSQSDSPRNLPLFDFVDANGKTLTYEYVVVPNNGNDGSQPFGYIPRFGSQGSITVNFAFYFSGPTELSLVYTKSRSPFGFSESVAVLQNAISKIQVIGKSRLEAESEFAKALQEEVNEQKRKEQSELNRVNSIKYTITCVASKGAKKETRKISGDPPACPKGFSNSQSSYPTFNSFISCKLYKRDSKDTSYVSLQDNGRTLTFVINEKYWSSGPSYPKISDLQCAMKTMRTPAFVSEQILNTRTIDGRISTQFGKIQVSWTYDFDTGLRISFFNK